MVGRAGEEEVLGSEEVVRVCNSLVSTRRLMHDDKVYQFAPIPDSQLLAERNIPSNIVVGVRYHFCGRCVGRMEDLAL